jgi:hypothetical protein
MEHLDTFLTVLYVMVDDLCSLHNKWPENALVASVTQRAAIPTQVEPLCVIRRFAQHAAR